MINSVDNIRNGLDHKSLDKVNILNEISGNNPDSISFTSGSPDSEKYNVKDSIDSISYFIEHLSKKHQICSDSAYKMIGNYSKSKGIINDILAKKFQNDEGFLVNENEIIVTSGGQESITLTLQTICNEGDAVLVVSPFFVGVEGALRALKLAHFQVEEAGEGVDIKSLESQIIKSKSMGYNTKALYCTPNYSNPTGICMSLKNRLELIEICKRYGIYILEDNTYGGMGWTESPPTLQSLDSNGRIIHIGTFSKSIYPGLRVGYIVTNVILNKNKKSILLADVITKLKTMTTNITSHISQSIVGGIICKNNYSLKEKLNKDVEYYKIKMDYLTSCLSENFRYSDGYSWNIPDGGFFIIFKTPFKVSMEDILLSSERSKVIWMPLNFFNSEAKINCEKWSYIRLAFGNLSKDQIKIGVERLSQYFNKNHLEKSA